MRGSNVCMPPLSGQILTLPLSFEKREATPVRAVLDCSIMCGDNSGPTEAYEDE